MTQVSDLSKWINRVDIYSDGEDEEGVGLKTMSSVLDILRLRDLLNIWMKHLRLRASLPLNQDYFKSTETIPAVTTLETFWLTSGMRISDVNRQLDTWLWRTRLWDNNWEAISIQVGLKSRDWMRSSGEGEYYLQKREYLWSWRRILSNI